MRKRASDLLEESAEVYRQRNSVYGDNYLTFGKVMEQMFNCGLVISAENDWNRLGILVQMVAKLTRYTANFHKGGHDDSLLDLATYTAMLREIDLDIATTKSEVDWLNRNLPGKSVEDRIVPRSAPPAEQSHSDLLKVIDGEKTP
jgi:hypothetical protein